MNFAENKVKTPTKAQPENNGSVNFKIGSMKKEPGGKIGEKLSELERIRLRSKSTNDISGGSDAKQLVKVNVHKRRSLFENAEPAEIAKSNDRLSTDISNSKTIKERLSNLEKNNEQVTKPNRLSGEMTPNIKDKISSLEKQASVDGSSCKRLSNGDISGQVSIKERLNTLKKQSEVEEPSKTKIITEEIGPVSVKERMSSFDASSSKEEVPKPAPERDVGFKEKLETFRCTEKNQLDPVHSKEPSFICSDKKEVNMTPLERLEVVEDKKLENETKCIDSINSKTEALQFSEKDIGTETNFVVENITVSSVASKKEEYVVPVQGDNSEGSGGGVEAMPNENEIETEKIKDVATLVREIEGNTNKLVKGQNGKTLTNTRGEIRKTHTTSPKDNSNPYLSKCDISETIVTQISLPESSIPYPRVNISVSIDSTSKNSSNGEEDEAMDNFSELEPLRSKDITKLNPPRNRVRKLTPIVTPSPILPVPLKTVCELQIIEEGESSTQIIEEEKIEAKSIAVHMTPGSSSDNEVQVRVQTRARHRKFL